MRTLAAELTAVQKVGGLPYVKVELCPIDEASGGANCVDITTDVLMLIHTEQQFGASATILVEDSAKALAPVDYRGYRVEISYGYTIGACFVTGTLVETPDGFVPIESLYDGASILSLDIETGATRNDTLTRLTQYDAKAIIRIVTEDDVVECTPWQPFLLPTGWTAAERIKPCDLIRSRAGESKVVSADRIVGPRQTWDFHVEDLSNAFVGKSELVSHNDGPVNYSSLGPPLWVRNKRNVSLAGRAMVEFDCHDLWQRLQMQQCMGSTLAAAPGWTGTTIYSIFSTMLSAICTIALDTDDGIINTYEPDYQIAQIDDPIAKIVVGLLAYTNSGCRVRPYELTGKIHFFELTGAGSDYTYEIATANHPFFTSSEDDEEGMVNRIIVCDSFPDADGTTHTYSGVANDTASQTRLGYIVTRVFEVDNLSSDAEATSMAEAILEQVKRGSSRGIITVPHNCGQEILDRVTVVDARTGETFTDYVGSLRHIYEKGGYRGQARYDLEIGFAAVGQGITTIPYHDYNSPAVEPEPEIPYYLGPMPTMPTPKSSWPADLPTLPFLLGPMPSAPAPWPKDLPTLSFLLPQEEEKAKPATQTPWPADLPTLSFLLSEHSPYGQKYSASLSEIHRNRRRIYPWASSPMLARVQSLGRSASSSHGYVPAGPGGKITNTQSWYFLDGGDADANYDALDILVENSIDGGVLADATTPAMDYVEATLTADGGTL